MADIFTPEKRSWIMSRIRSTNTGIDLKMEHILDVLRYKHEMYPKMYGNPDFVLRRKKIAIFCDGDFWHGFNYLAKKKPPQKYWRQKIKTNMKRDKKISRKLRTEGWSVLRFWEHDINKDQEKCIRKILRKTKRRKRNF